ncbi:PEPTIDYL-PROLYL CIS-TRANS ISOMERASE G [Salix viminalis]|uniref:PEPTIDYL-PROLYL CIS-TRANS ISOMERASE G n=1 Tax=Salix viminalis TaxID=40686 RepID=A0A6N2MQ75_SALVM|nr:PEPTIDYL-PROLYL CIS-TRANS ISOMERASE G [Salix viminalis]
MARPWVVVFLLLLIGFTSQIEWKRQLGNEIEASPNISQKDHHHQQHSSKRQEVVKEKIIISQEKNIQKLNELVQSLQEQLQQCRSENYVLNSTAIPLTEHLNELKQQPILDD